MDGRRTLGAMAGTVSLVLLVQIGALLVVDPFDEAYEVVADPADPTNWVVFVGVLLVVTAFMLLAFKYDLDRAIRASIVGVSGLLSWYLLDVVVPPVAVIAGYNALALLGATIVVAALLVHPEWYVIDAAGVLTGASAAALFGISFTPLPAILLLVALAIYDAISVYGTEHMLTLAGGVIDLRVPVVLVIPLTVGYSFLEPLPPEVLEGGSGGEPTSSREDETASAAPDSEVSRRAGADGEADGELDPNGDAERAEAAERDAIFLGLGDAVLPTVLVASSAAFPPVEPAGFVGLPTLGAMIGTAFGAVVLVLLVSRGRAHAGLPWLNGGVIAGYLLGSLAAGVSLSAALGV